MRGLAGRCAEPTRPGVAPRVRHGSQERRRFVPSHASLQTPVSENNSFAEQTIENKRCLLKTLKSANKLDHVFPPCPPSQLGFRGEHRQAAWMWCALGEDTGRLACDSSAGERLAPVPDRAPPDLEAGRWHQRRVAGTPGADVGSWWPGVGLKCTPICFSLTVPHLTPVHAP